MFAGVALLALAAWSPLGRAQVGSRPIVDVRFDGPYRQVLPSLGDEWAPTWGRNDVLYTGNDDGSSFGGMPDNPIAFGKLEGNDPYALRGTTINPMDDFTDRRQPGPDGAGWKTLNTWRSQGVLYMFVTRCADPAEAGDPSRHESIVYTSLITSTDDGKTWTKSPDATHGRPLFASRRWRAPAFISYRPTTLESLGAGADQYVYAASYAGIVSGDERYLVGRVLESRLDAMNPADWTFFKIGTGSMWNPHPDEGSVFPNSSGVGPDHANWKTMNSYSVDGVLYMFVTRCLYPALAGDLRSRHVFMNASIIKSVDGGETWTRPAAENFRQPMFPGQRFGAPYFVWYGRDGAAKVDHADQYVYAVSNDGHFESGDNYVLGRVLRTRLPDLNAADWSFYQGGRGEDDASWGPRADQAAPILPDANNAGMTGMTYIPGFGRYVMVVWHYHYHSYLRAMQHRDVATVLEFFEAPRPWGPWTRFKTLDTGPLGWYAPVIGQRFQVAADAQTVTCFLYAPGLYYTPAGEMSLLRYRFNYMPITLSTAVLPHADPAYVGGR